MQVAEQLSPLSQPTLADEPPARPRPAFPPLRGLAAIEAAENAGRALRFAKAPVAAPSPRPRRRPRRLGITVALLAAGLATALTWWAVAAAVG